ncbi:MAG TPA: hypothetical protein VLH10_25455 [Yinghuangia sp.]|uniref:hypothetical protein n=1 Tax=Yinghuangia sp. YIM S10712 TaxID=3436930 RepID=UPI002B975CBE|nr:hypothetical protein [Yinghuangia sp.]
MFDKVVGLRPEEAACWSAMVEQCQPVLANQGMEAVQTLLAAHGMSVIQAIAITRALLGWEVTTLRTAIDIVTASAARTALVALADDRSDADEITAASITDGPVGRTSGGTV